MIFQLFYIRKVRDATFCPDSSLGVALVPRFQSSPYSTYAWLFRKDSMKNDRVSRKKNKFKSILTLTAPGTSRASDKLKKAGARRVTLKRLSGLLAVSRMCVIYHSLVTVWTNLFLVPSMTFPWLCYCNPYLELTHWYRPRTSSYLSSSSCFASCAMTW